MITIKATLAVFFPHTFSNTLTFLPSFVYKSEINSAYYIDKWFKNVIVFIYLFILEHSVLIKQLFRY